MAEWQSLLGGGGGEGQNFKAVVVKTVPGVTVLCFEDNLLSQ